MLNSFKKKADFLPIQNTHLVLYRLKSPILLTLINKTVFLYNGTFYNKRFLNFFFFSVKLSELVLTKKFKKTKPYM